MIPRHQKLLFGILLAASLIMAVLLWNLRERAHRRMIAGQDSTHTSVPLIAPAEQVTLMVANDSDGSMLAQLHSLPLPGDSGARARAALGKLLDLYAAPDAAHPVPGGGTSVLQVFLMAAPGLGGSSMTSSQPKTGAAGAKAPATLPQEQQTGPQLAVVNLSGSFAANHPSGIETETLTVLSICATLHTNLPRVIQVRFLVDGQTRPTLAGHADLTHAYLVGDAEPAEGVHP